MQRKIFPKFQRVIKMQCPICKCNIGNDEMMTCPTCDARMCIYCYSEWGCPMHAVPYGDKYWQTIFDPNNQTYADFCETRDNLTSKKCGTNIRRAFFCLSHKAQSPKFVFLIFHNAPLYSEGNNPCEKIHLRPTLRTLLRLLGLSDLRYGILRQRQSVA